MSEAHDPLCDWRPCTCPLDYDVPERGHMIGCPEDDCECEIIAKVRADTIDKARKAVEVLPHTADCKAWSDEGQECCHRDVIEVLDAVVGSPDFADVLAFNSRTIRH